MKFTNKHNLPESLVRAIMNDPYDVNQADGDTISVTTLILPPRIRILRVRHWENIEVDVSETIWSLFGQACHSVLERVEMIDSLPEERITVEVSGKKITGKTDLYHADGGLEDYKVTSVWTIVYNPEGKKEWEWQLNILAWLFRSIGFNVNYLNIQAILRDWSKKDAIKNYNYPRINVKTVPIELWSFADQQKFVFDRVNLHVEAEALEDKDLPICSKEERWASDDTWAVFWNGNKTAKKVCKTEEEASAYEADLKNNPKCKSSRIEHRPGIDRRCQDYCSVNKFCSYYQEKYINL